VTTEDYVTVTGNAGEGKTALIRHVALELLCQRYEIVPVNDPQEIEKYYDDNVKQVFIIDDACGVHTVDDNKRIKWKDYSQIIESNLRHSKAKLLVTARLLVSNDKQFQDIGLLCKNIVNLSAPTYSLLQEDRFKIFHSHFEKSYSELGISEQSLNAHRHFPLLCRLASHQFDLSKKLTQTPGLNLSAYFMAPIDFYKNEIRSLQLESPLTYCILVLCTLFNGKLPKRILSTSRQYADLVKDCCESCGLNRGTSRIKLLEKVASLENVYLSQNEDDIVFVHDFLMDIISKYICDDSPSLIITHSSCEFIRDSVKLSFPGEPQEDAREHVIFLDERYHTAFFDRLYQDINNGQSYLVFGHNQIKATCFQKAMSEFLESKATHELKHTLFNVQNNATNRHILNLIDFFIQFLQNKPIKIDVHDLLRCFAQNAFDWILGKGLHVILHTVYKHLERFIKDEIMAHKDFYRYLIILGGSVDIHSWYLQMRHTSVMRRLGALLDCCSETEYVKMDFQLTVLTGNESLLSFILNRYPCAKTLKADNTYYRLLILYQVLLYGNSIPGAKLTGFLFKMFSYVANYTGPFRTHRNYLHWVKMIIYQGLLTDDEQINTVLVKRYESELLPLLQRRREHLESIFNDLPSAPTMYDVARSQLDTTRSYLEIASELGYESLVSLLLTTTDVNYTCTQTNVISKHSSSYSIVMAAMNGQTRIVDILLLHGANKNACSESGCTTLMLASSYGHLDTVKLLLGRKVKVNAQNSLLNTALIYASRKGHKEIVASLLHYGSDSNIKGQNGKTALIEASANGHFEIVEILLNENASIDIADGIGVTALMKATQNKYPQIVELLTTRNASASLHTSNGKTALVFAAESGCLESLTILLDSTKCTSFDVDETVMVLPHLTEEHRNKNNLIHLPFNSFGTIPSIDEALVIAVEEGCMDVMKALLCNGADVNSRDKSNTTVMNKAIKYGHSSIVHLLCQHNADVNLQGECGVTPLILAAEYGHVEITNILLENGANVNTRSYCVQISSIARWIRVDENQCSALIIATIHRHLIIAKLLLKDKRINVNSRTQNGFTALIMAVLTEQIELVRLLIQNGANVNMETKSRHTALEIAIDEMCFPIGKLLIENDACTRFSKTRTTKYIGLLLPVPLEMLGLFMVQDVAKFHERTSRIRNNIWFSVFVWLIWLCGFLLYFFEMHAV
jgi:serine/threonine-protein phosphatase 6 regulatory ankyrin repeat subunit B